MRKSLLTGVLVFFVVSAAATQDMAVATVKLEKTEPISEYQLNEMIQAIEQMEGRHLTMEEKKVVLNQLIDQAIVLQAAEFDKQMHVSDTEVEDAGIMLLSQQLSEAGVLPPGAILTDKEQYRQIVEEQGISVEEYEKNVRKQLLAEKYITLKNAEVFRSISAATEEELSSEYQRRVQEFVIKDSVWFNHIFFDTSDSNPEESMAKNEKAKAVYNRLINTSATFEDLVISESEDEVSKVKGGVVGPVMVEDEIANQIYGSEFIASVFSMEEGETSRVLKSNIGYHIVQITEKKPAQLLPENDAEVRAYLERVIYAAHYQEALEKVTKTTIAELRERATINYFGDYK